MLTFEEFENYLYKVSEEIPDKYYQELNGGITASEACKVHPKSVGDELCIMGEYRIDGPLGRRIILHYGSFVKQFQYMSDGFWKEEIKKVLQHELTHHLESLAGERDLEIEDEIKLAQYEEGKKLP